MNFEKYRGMAIVVLVYFSLLTILFLFAGCTYEYECDLENNTLVSKDNCVNTENGYLLCLTHNNQTLNNEIVEDIRGMENEN